MFGDFSYFFKVCTENIHKTIVYNGPLCERCVYKTNGSDEFAVWLNFEC